MDDAMLSRNIIVLLKLSIVFSLFVQLWFILILRLNITVKWKSSFVNVDAQNFDPSIYSALS